MVIKSQAIPSCTARICYAYGCLPTHLAQLLAVRSRQQGAVAQARCEAREQGLPAPCVQQLHLSLFFDGTHHHGDADDAANPARRHHQALATRRKHAGHANATRNTP